MWRVSPSMPDTATTQKQQHSHRLSPKQQGCQRTLTGDSSSHQHRSLHLRAIEMIESTAVRSSGWSTSLWFASGNNHDFNILINMPLSASAIAYVIGHGMLIALYITQFYLLLTLCMKTIASPPVTTVGPWVREGIQESIRISLTYAYSNTYNKNVFYSEYILWI